MNCSPAMQAFFVLLVMYFQPKVCYNHAASKSDHPSVLTITSVGNDTLPKHYSPAPPAQLISCRVNIPPVEYPQNPTYLSTVVSCVRRKLLLPSKDSSRGPHSSFLWRKASVLHDTHPFLIHFCFLVTRPQQLQLHSKHLMASCTRGVRTRFSPFLHAKYMPATPPPPFTLHRTLD